MEPTSAGPAYLAVTKAEKTKIWKEQILNPSVFSWSPRTYSKLFPDREAAVKQALKVRTLESAKVALEPTTFYLLSLYFTDKQWLNLFFATEEPSMQMGPQRKAYRLYGTLKNWRGEARLAPDEVGHDRYRRLGGLCPGKVHLVPQRPLRRMRGQ